MHDHDEKWHSEMIAKLPYKYRITAISGYADAYESAYSVEPVQHKKGKRSTLCSQHKAKRVLCKSGRICQSKRLILVVFANANNG